MAHAAYFDDMRARTVPRLLAFAAETHGQCCFLRESGSQDWLTFAEVARQSHAAARGFARLGIKRGDYVPFMLPNCPEFVLAWFGVNLRAAAYISVNTSLSWQSARRPTGSSRPQGFGLCTRSTCQLSRRCLRALRAKVEALVVVGPGQSHGSGVGPCHSILRTCSLRKAPDAEETCHFLDVSAVTFTSGTTGPSKGVTATQGQAISSARTFSKLVDLGPDDVIYTPLPLFHGMSSRMGMLPAMLAGCPIVLGKRFSGSRFWDEVIEADATVAQIIFSIPNVLLAQPPKLQGPGPSRDSDVQCPPYRRL